MIYIYNCFGGTHTSALAAAYHLRKLPLDRVPSKTEILNTDAFNRLAPQERGKMVFHGDDGEGNKVYSVGRGNSKALIPAMRSVFRLFENNNKLEETVVFSNTSPTVPLVMTVGGFFSKALKMDFIGVPLLVMGSKQAHYDIITLVEETVRAGKINSSKVVTLNNKHIK